MSISCRRRPPRRPRDLDRRRDKLVSNLPYNVATPIVVESLDGLPSSRAGA
jgi:16S rRNA A1518/A1519 N6-dimethyltransferase RsmA/KsgA/DIM1 with predicted DNA glycosylase/AP lyase activity